MGDLDEDWGPILSLNKWLEAKQSERLFVLLMSHALFPHPPRTPTMASSQRPKGRDTVLATLDALIQALNVARDTCGTCGIPPAQVAFGSACVLLTMIRVSLFLFRKGKLLAHDV